MLTLPDADRQRLRQQLEVQESWRPKPYLDTRKKLTIGFGRNLTDKGISIGESYYLLDNDIDEAIDDFEHVILPDYPGLRGISPVRQAVLINMVYNMGVGELKFFVHFLRRLSLGNFDGAADAMLDSLWASQVGSRAKTLAEQMRTGMWQ